MKLLEKEVRDEIFGAENRIYTKVKDQVPTQYKEGSSVSDSLVADGCVIKGTVENSILFRGVHVAKGAVVKDSVLFSGTYVGKNSNLNCIVTDKDVHITRGVKLSGGGFWLYRGLGARLEWALLNYFIDTHWADGYELILPPHMLEYECGVTAGQFPKFADEVYKIENPTDNH